MHPDTSSLYEELFEATPSGLVVIDQSGLVAFVNRRAEAMLGRDRGDLVGKPIGALGGKPSGALGAGHSGEAAAALLAAGSDRPAELVLRRANAEDLTVEAIT